MPVVLRRATYAGLINAPHGPIAQGWVVLLKCRLHWRTSCPSDRRPDMSNGQIFTWMADTRGMSAPMSVPYCGDKAQPQK